MCSFMSLQNVRSAIASLSRSSSAADLSLYDSDSALSDQAAATASSPPPPHAASSLLSPSYTAPPHAAAATPSPGPALPSSSPLRAFSPSLGAASVHSASSQASQRQLLAQSKKFEVPVAVSIKEVSVTAKFSKSVPQARVGFYVKDCACTNGVLMRVMVSSWSQSCHFWKNGARLQYMRKAFKR